MSHPAQWFRLQLPALVYPAHGGVRRYPSDHSLGDHGLPELHRDVNSCATDEPVEVVAFDLIVVVKGEVSKPNVRHLLRDVRAPSAQTDDPFASAMTRSASSPRNDWRLNRSLAQSFALWGTEFLGPLLLVMGSVLTLRGSPRVGPRLALMASLALTAQVLIDAIAKSTMLCAFSRKSRRSAASTASRSICFGQAQSKSAMALKRPSGP